MNEKIREIVDKVIEKYKNEGEDPAVYLESLYHQKYLSYWDYIMSDQLLKLQKPITDHPDEMVFILYHQITELYFKLVLWECRQIREMEVPNAGELIKRVIRINQYFRHLTNSFSIMTYGMEPEQFLKFRVALTPASGFQSVQFRYIELSMTPIENLLASDVREKLKGRPVEEQYQQIYWKHGATEVDTGKKAMVLKNFEKMYDQELLEIAKAWHGKTVYDVYRSLPEAERNGKKMLNVMKVLDKQVNVSWPGVHYKTARHYLEAGGVTKAATGGTNWKQYLPPEFRKVTFFPELWDKEELKYKRGK